MFRNVLDGLPALRIPVPPDHIRHAYYKFYAYVRPTALKSDWSRDRILAEVMACNINCGSGSCGEIYLEKAFRSTNLAPAVRLPVAQQSGETLLMFLVHPTLSATEVADIAEVVGNVVQAATLH